jgi:diphthine-ammonia ligase
MRVVVSWSGGKDSCLACYEAISRGLEISTLLNFVFEDSTIFNGRKISSVLNFVLKDRITHNPAMFPGLLKFLLKGESSWAVHKISPEVVAMQAKAMGLPMIQRETTWECFEEQFKSTIRNLKINDVKGSVWGLESDGRLVQEGALDAQKEWISRVCDELNLKPILPLWGRKPEEILADFVTKGFEAIFLVVNSKMGEKWLGQKINRDFLKKITKLDPVERQHLFSQLGDFHTLVTDGPFFKKRLEILESKKTVLNHCMFLDIFKCDLVDKTV